ncbi:DUF3363 domain-containing protein [Asticcacaulis sp.]|uniref:DUF3363 domain-containing protein n=1 Tax=Asticcacaulis sp. TaxID=1872648 RepID=UPI00391B2099
MADKSDNDFTPEMGRIRTRGASRLRMGLPRGSELRAQSFIKQVEAAIRRAGGNPRKLGATPKTGRFNARGRGGKLAVSQAKSGGGWKGDAAGRFSRRVIVKARVVKLRGQRGSKVRFKVATSKAVDAHLRYLERDGVNRDGSKGHVYSALENEADGPAFLKRGRDDQHQFRFIVAPEDALEMEDFKSFTRDLMGQMETDLDTKLDWVAVDHYNTGHPHTHILLRGVTDDGKVLNIAGDYIAHGIRNQAGLLVERELGLQTQAELDAKLASEINVERLTRLDRLLIAEQKDKGHVDLRPGEADNYLIRQNREVLLQRMNKLESLGLADTACDGIWLVYDKAEKVLNDLAHRHEIHQSIHTAIVENGLEGQRGTGQYVVHGTSLNTPVTGLVLGKGLAGEGLSDKLYMVIDGVDARVHYVEIADPQKLSDIKRGMIVEAAPFISGPRAADKNIATFADEHGIYRPSHHLNIVRPRFEAQDKDPEAFVKFHVRRLEALRRAGHVERIDEDHWRVPKDLVTRGQSYDMKRGGDGTQVRTLSLLRLEVQINRLGATWLDREMSSSSPTGLSEAGFGGEVRRAMQQRADALCRAGLGVKTPGGRVKLFPDVVDRLTQREFERVGKDFAAETGKAFLTGPPANKSISGKLACSVQMTSGKYAMIETERAFRLVPWEPMFESRLGKQISGRLLDGGGIDWQLGRNRGLDIGM